MYFAHVFQQQGTLTQCWFMLAQRLQRWPSFMPTYCVNISCLSDWWRCPSWPIRSLRYIVTCTIIRTPSLVSGTHASGSKIIFSTAVDCATLHYICKWDVCTRAFGTSGKTNDNFPLKYLRAELAFCCTLCRFKCVYLSPNWFIVIHNNL